jgi:hypothetical protein
MEEPATQKNKASTRKSGMKLFRSKFKIPPHLFHLTVVEVAVRP